MTFACYEAVRTVERTRSILTQEEIKNLTCVESRTPVGEVLRRYWHPVAAVAELDERSPIKPVKLLGEDLVVFRNLRGQYGLLGEQCPHRLASFAYGSVDEDGIRCPHHGWKFDRAGRCLEQPAEPTDSTYMQRIRHTAYLVEKLAGLLFAYMGPAPAPFLPRWDVLARTDGHRWIEIQPALDCNWLQPMENSVDPSYSYWLHGKSAHPAQHQAAHEGKYEFTRFEYGIMKKRITPGKKDTEPPLIDQHPLLFPTTLRRVTRGDEPGKFWHNLEMRVPRDDSHTQVYTVYFEPSSGTATSPETDPPHVPLEDSDGVYDRDYVLGHDAMAGEAQGAITHRNEEDPGGSDEGILLLRRILDEQIETVRKGRDPLGTMRNPTANDIIELDVINEPLGLFGGKWPESQSKAGTR